MITVDESDIRLACVLADAADPITEARFGSSDLEVRAKPDRSPVTDADLAVETVLRELLARERPEDEFVGEEGGGEVGDGRTWIIDPIDGTKAFLRGLPVWATLVALLVEGRPVVGAVSAPALGRRWWAGAGHGTYVRAPGGEARKVSVSGVARLEDAVVSTSHLNTWPRFHDRRAYLSLVDACWEDRAYGDFWSHCLVAEGALDLATDPIVNAWDVAALKVLVEEAGGRFTDLTGADTIHGGTSLSSNTLLHQAALSKLAMRPEAEGATR